MRDIDCWGTPRPPRLIDTAPAEPAICNQSSTFYPFSRLPTELQGEIWLHFLPSRIVQQHLDYRAIDTWGYDDHWDRSPYKNVPERRSLPAPFFVHRKSRAFCLGQYLLIGKTYVHPTLDILLVSRSELQNINFSFYRPSSEEDRPLNRLRTIAIELEKDQWGYQYPSTECGALIKILYYLGSPRDLIFCFQEPKVLSQYRTAETPFLDGNQIKLRCWPDDYETATEDGDLDHEVYNSEQRTKDRAIRFLQQQVIPGFEFPKVEEIPNVRDEVYHYYPRYIEAPYGWTPAVQPLQLSQPAEVPPSSSHVHVRKRFFCLPTFFRRLGCGMRGLFKSS